MDVGFTATLQVGYNFTKTLFFYAVLLLFIIL